MIETERGIRLQLKSREGGDSVVCTHDKTFNLRQVSTSNTVLLAEPCVEQDDENQIPQQGLRAIAQPQSTLEVLPTTNLSAVPHIKSALPVFTSTRQYSAKDGITKEDLFANNPLSDIECERGWKELACFEVELPAARHAIIPSASVQLKAWKSILELANASMVDLTQTLGPEQMSVIVQDLDNEWPIALLKAMLRSMTVHPEADVLELDSQMCAGHVGRALLKDSTDTSKGTISVAAFKAAWADLLPEQWRPYATLDTIEGSYTLENGGRDIVHAESSGVAAANANGGAPEEAKSTLGAKRKWHEKFRASKKTS